MVIILCLYLYVHGYILVFMFMNKFYLFYVKTSIMKCDYVVHNCACMFVYFIISYFVRNDKI